MAMKKTKGLPRLLITCFLRLVGALFVVGIGIWVSITLALQTGVMLPANYTEQAVLTLQENLEANPNTPATPKDFPDNIEYAIFNQEGECIAGNMTETSVKQAYHYVVTGEKSSLINGNRSYRLIVRPVDTVVIQYYLSARYANPKLNDWLMPPEILILVLAFVVYVILAALIIKRCSNRMKRELEPLRQIAQAVAEGELDYRVSDSGIREFNDIQKAMDAMRDSLRDSLAAQWQAEQHQQEEISALAHDIKTPLTIIQGNAELLTGELSGEAKESAIWILDNSAIIARYLDVLLTVTRQPGALVLNQAPLDITTLAEDMAHQAEGYMKGKNIYFTKYFDELPQKINADAEMLTRAVMNLLTNGVDYTPEGSWLFFNVKAREGRIVFSVLDSGPGFSEEGLARATEKFYQEDNARSRRGHFGMGLYTARQIAVAHGGGLCLANAEDAGAIVSLWVPIAEFLEDS